MQKSEREDHIQKLTDTLSRAVGGDYSVRLATAGMDAQLAPLLAAINRLIEAMHQEITGLRADTLCSRQLIESLHEAVCVSDVSGVLTYVNKCFCSMLDVEAEAVVGKKFSALLDEANMDRWLEHQEKRRQGEPTTYELEMTRKDGSKVAFITSGAPLFDADGQQLGAVGVLTDITERRRQEEELRLFQFSLDEAPDAVFWMNRDAGFTNVNNEACRSLGYTREELLRLHLWDIDPNFPIEIFGQSWRELQDSGEVRVRKHESQHRRKDGSTFPVEVSAKHFWFGGNQYHVSFARNISERKAADEELGLTQFAIDHASIGCFWCSVDGRIQYVNQQACHSLGYTREDLLGMSVMEIHPELSPRKWNEFWHLATENEIQTFETTHLRKDGTRIPVGITANHIEFGGKRFSCAYVHDLSDIKQREQALRISEERLRQAVRVANVGILDHDHLAGTVYWSPKLREIRDRDPDEPVRTPGSLERVHPEEREIVAEARRRAHDPKGGGVYDIEYRILWRDGSVHWTTARSQTFFEGEGEERHPVRTIGAVRDITDAKRAEEEAEKLQAQLLQAQKMESVGRLAGGVAHDFNNMLGVILGHAELAQQKLDPASPLAANLQQITEAAERSADLTRQLLAFARKQTIAPKVLDLNETVEGMLQMLRSLIGEDIHVVWEPGPRIWPVRVDPAQLHQVLANLLINSRDAIAGGGRVSLQTENVVLDETYCSGHVGSVTGPFVRLTVSDDGGGMDEETLDNLFEPFFTTKGEGQGTGLGMAMVYGIVKQNDGFINVYSEVDQGTTVDIYLPRHEAKIRPVTGEDRALEPVGGSETILTVEDEPMVLELVGSILRGLGYTVLGANTPTQAIQLAKAHSGPIHLLITDVIMPEMNGRDVAERLCPLFPGLRSLYMSGYPADVITHRGMLEEGVHFLQKPFSKQTLASKVREVLKSR